VVRQLIVESEEVSFVPDISDFEQDDHLYIQTETIINNLNKRQSRKLCQPLGIQQKCGQAEKSLTFIKAEIRDLFTSHPEKVIGVIREKLPELIGVSAQASEITGAIAS
jgi:hypothetical protein